MMVATSFRVDQQGLVLQWEQGVAKEEKRKPGGISDQLRFLAGGKVGGYDAGDIGVQFRDWLSGPVALVV